MEQIRLADTAISAAGLVGTVLALAGVFAVTAWRVVQQRRDMAIRIALGAGHAQVLPAFVGSLFAVAMAGAGAGLLISVWTATLLRTSVRGVHAPHPALYASAALVILGLVLLAAILPARQILRVDPSTGNYTVFASGLPKTPPGFGDGGTFDVTFIGNTAYAR